MTENNTQEKIEKAVLVGLSAHSLNNDENATDSSMEELAALLERQAANAWVWSPSPRTALTPAPLSARARWPK